MLGIWCTSSLSFTVWPAGNSGSSCTMISPNPMEVAMAMTMKPPLIVRRAVIGTW